MCTYADIYCIYLYTLTCVSACTILNVVRHLHTCIYACSFLKFIHPSTHMPVYPNCDLILIIFQKLHVSWMKSLHGIPPPI